MTYLLGMLKAQTHFCNYKGAEIQEKQYGTSDFKTIRLSNIQTFWNLIPYFILLISRLPNIVQKSFCTPDKAMDPTFPMNYALAREIKKKMQHIFSGHPVLSIMNPNSFIIYCIFYILYKISFIIHNRILCFKYHISFIEFNDLLWSSNI